MRVAALGLVLFTILSPSAMALEEGYAPLMVVAIETTDLQAVVAWIPGPDTAVDSFRVYGIDSGTAYLISEVEAESEASDALSALVPSGYATYAVSGVKAGVESLLTYAEEPDIPHCVVIDPPSIGIRCNPLEKIGPIHIMVFLPSAPEIL